ncbi:beta-carotene 15,15'-monooxygenase [Rhodococcus rhodochrous]|nr:beta-carotene 15,15'-monooxygenase [Rhodococcus rhodochrous]
MTTRRVIDPAGALFGLGLPLVAAGVALLLPRLWESRLPPRIATHWSGSAPDGFSDPASFSWTMALVILLVGGGCSAIAALAPAMLMMRRYMLVLGLGVTGLLFTLCATVLAGQLDAPAEQAQPPMWSIGAGVALGVAVGILGASLLRDHRVRRSAVACPDPALPRGPVELPIVEQVGTGTRTTLVLAALVLAPAVLVCGAARSWWPLAIFLPVAVLVLSLLRFRVVVDDTGVRVQNLGMTAVDYGLDEIVGAKVAHVRPFQDWGGWGLRAKGRGRYGLVTITGPALVVTVAGGQEFTVTASQAERMAGALNTLADRR